MSSRDTPFEQMPVVILAGGLGTRLREATERLPKPLVPIGEQPILWHIMKLYGHHGARRFVLCLGYKSWNIKEYFLRYREQLSDVTVKLGGEHTAVFNNQPADEDWEVTLAETTTVFAGRTWIKIAIPSTGFYRIDFGTLRLLPLFGGQATPFDRLRLFRIAIFLGVGGRDSGVRGCILWVCDECALQRIESGVHLCR